VKSAFVSKGLVRKGRRQRTDLEMDVEVSERSIDGPETARKEDKLVGSE